MEKRRVVITGLGCVSPIGNNVEITWKNMLQGKSGIAKITSMPNINDFPVVIGGELKDFDPSPYYKNPKDIKRSDRYTQMGMVSSIMAYRDSGIELEKTDLSRFGVLVGSGIGGLSTLEKNYAKYFEKKNCNRVSPFVIPMMIANILSGTVAIELGLMGPNMSIVTACATSNHNIGEAWRMIKFGDADVFLAGGAEAPICTMGMGGFSKMRALSPRNEQPELTSRPFDKDRDGFVIGEGAGVVIVEELEHAKKRGAKIYCEIIGYGVSCDAFHMTSPHPEGNGAKLCMQMALKHANLNPQQIDYINAHGTSTQLGDICETKAIKKTFGEYAKNGLLVSSTKSMTGHLLGAAGGVELITCIQAIENGIIPPTINLEQADEQCDLDYIPNKAREAKVNIALSNSFGFGGHNACLAIKRFEN